MIHGMLQKYVTHFTFCRLSFVNAYRFFLTAQWSACSCVVVNCSVFVTCEPIPSLSASASASAAVTTSLSEQVEATLLAIIATILHTTLLYLWDIVIWKEIKATFMVGLCDSCILSPGLEGAVTRKKVSMSLQLIWILECEYDVQSQRLCLK